MSEYKGFITRAKYKELSELLGRIAEVRGLENKLIHLYSPDTDMNDKVCENFEISIKYALLDIDVMIKQMREFREKIVNLSED